MAPRLGQLYVSVRCEHCGPHPYGVPLDGDKSNRCDQCGRFAKKADGYCAEHDLDYKGLSGWARCPYCEEEERVQAERVHQMTRDPTVEPW